MTHSVTINETTHTVTVTQAAPQVITVSAQGPQGPSYTPPRGVTIENPTPFENITLMRLDRDAVIESIVSVVGGTTPDVTFSLRWGPDRSAAGTEVVTGGILCAATTTGQVTSGGTLTSPTIPTNSWLWLTTSATNGTVSTFHVTVNFA